MRMGCQQQLVLTHTHNNGATRTIFEATEAWLDESADHQKALKYVARYKRKRMDQYRAVMDFLFCEIFLKYQRPCFKFYRGDGPLLKELMTEEEIEAYDRRMLIAVKHAHGLFCRDRERGWSSGRLNWTSFRCEVLRLSA